MKKLFSATLGAGLLIAPLSAFAHHPLAGLPMETFTQGFLSGIGHPILGFDHLFFVCLLGISALYTGYRYASPAAYIAAMLLGCWMMSAGIGLPAKEIVVSLSLLTLGACVLSGRALGLGFALVVFSGFGVFHGSAFGNVLVGQEAVIGSQVLSGYMLGLGMVQYGTAISVGWVMMTVFRATSAKAIEARLTGAIVAGMGLFLTMENFEGLLFNLMGWAS